MTSATLLPIPSMSQGIYTETLELLEWSRLCDHLATFAGTDLGRKACGAIAPWWTQSHSEELLSETAEAIAIELSLPGGMPLQGIYDLEDYLARVDRGGSLKGFELLEVASTLGTARKVRRLLDEREDAPLLKDALSSIRTYPELERQINHCIDDRGRVMDRASEKLGNLRLSMRQVRDRIRQKLQNIIGAKSSAIQEAVVTEREGRFVIPVKATHRDVIKGLVHDSSASGATLYIEPNSVVADNNKRREQQKQEQREEERILAELSEAVAEVTLDLNHLLSILVLVDCAVARARYSLWLGAFRPSFESDRLSLRQVRHPLLLRQSELAKKAFERGESEEEGFEPTPIDLTLDIEKRAVVITGPNTGGKTVTLKTLGLMVLMAKAGIYLPAKEPVHIPWFDGVFADIGDEQSLEQSLSTFSGHIRRIGRILDEVDERSLVLLDEAGAGTDPNEGAALASALLEHLSGTARLTMASTHYGDLKSLKYQNSVFENASVEFDAETLAPTYRVLWGIPGRSHALAVAQRLGLETAVLDDARLRLGEDSNRVDEAIEGLVDQRASLEQKWEELAVMQRQMEGLRREMEARAKALAEREAALDLEKKAAIEQAIRSAKGEVASVIRRLQKEGATGQDAQAASKDLARIARQAQKIKPKKRVVPTEFYPEVGDRVRIPDLGQVGEVLAADGNDFTVRSGILKMSVKLDQLEPLDEVQKKKRQRPKAVAEVKAVSAQKGVAIRTSRNTLDIRGQRVADAEHQLADWIANAASGAVWIIHGHGTGKLRVGVQSFLKSHGRVTKFEAAEAADGGTGATVAYLK